MQGRYSPEVKLALKFNAAVVAINGVGHFFGEALAFYCGVALIAAYGLLALKNPKLAFYVIIGSKLTFDSLWWIPAAIGPLRLTELVLAPFGLCFLLSVHPKRLPAARTVLLAIAFVGWCFAAQIANGEIRADMLIRLSGCAVGFLIGLSMIDSRRDVDLMFQLTFLSALVPILASAIQLIAAQFGVSVFFFTLDSVRGIRYSGIYYDAATTGMVMLIAILSSVFLLYSNAIKPRQQLAVYYVMSLAYFVALVGATRSVVAVATVALAAFFMTRFSRAVRIAPILAVALILGQPYIEKLQKRTMAEFDRSKISFAEIEFDKVLTDTRYSTLMTGRIMVWQHVYRLFQRGSTTQQFLGSAKVTHAHSTYFFLLVYIGIAGTLLYVILNASMVVILLQVKENLDVRNVALIGLVLFLMMGISTTTVTYTSFQWAVYLIIGACVRLTSRQSSRKAIQLSDI